MCTRTHCCCRNANQGPSIRHPTTCSLYHSALCIPLAVSVSVTLLFCSSICIVCCTSSYVCSFIFNPLKLSGHFMYCTVVTICTAQWSTYVQHSGHYMYRRFNIQQPYTLYTLYVFCIYLRTNSDLCHLQHKLIGFYNRYEKCLRRGTDWVFK